MITRIKHEASLDSCRRVEERFARQVRKHERVAVYHHTRPDVLTRGVLQPNACRTRIRRELKFQFLGPGAVPVSVRQGTANSHQCAEQGAQQSHINPLHIIVEPLIDPQRSSGSGPHGL